MIPRRWQPVVLVALVLLAFSNSFRGEFFYDDYPAIVQNPHLRHWSTAWDAPDQSPLAGRPVVSLTFAVNHALSGLRPWSYHVVNVAIHIGCALLVWGIVRRVKEEIALPVAALWAVHPLVTESVNYVTQRMELLFGLFLLLTLYCFARRWHIGSVVACAVGMGCKETMVVAPVIVALFDWAFCREQDRPRKYYYAGLFATWIVLAAWVLTGARTETVGFQFRELSAWQYLFTQGGVILHYLRLAVWPQPLVVDYDDWPVALMVTWQAVLVAGLVAGSVWLFWKRPRLGFLAAWFFVILAPTSSVLPIVSEVAAERRMYLPLLAVIVPVAWALCRARSLASFRGFAPSAEPASRRGAKLEHDIELRALQWRQPLVGVVVVALACVTWARNQDYRTEVSIMSDTVVKRPHNTRALTNLGVALVRAGKMELAVPHLENAIRLNPRQADAHFNLAMIRAEQKRWADAERHLRMVVELEPGNERARAALATVRRLMQ